MLPLVHLNKVQRLLFLGAHCDDIEIGAGGTIARLIEQYPKLSVCWVVFGGEDPVRVKEARRSARVYLAGAGKKDVIVHGYRDGYMPFQGEQIKESFEELKQSFAPDLILTHHDNDRHQDHRLISEMTWNTWRDHTILEYEIFKYDGDLGRPNLYVPLSEEVCREKVSRLFKSYPSQAKRAWFTEDTFWSLLRLRGAECNSPSRFAEAFYVRKLVVA